MELYHALNRGVDKRTIFLDTQDYARFVHDMFEFNSDKPANNTWRSHMVELRSRPLNDSRSVNRTNTIVDIHGWCLMENHYHLLLSERVEGGVSDFLRKLNIGYAKYFNERYERKGTLFQGRTKKIHIKTDAHVLHILNYVHLNPLDFQKDTRLWREQKIQNIHNATELLEKYRWSSLRDYSGVKNFPSIVTTSFFQKVFQGDYMGQLKKYLRDISAVDVAHLKLE